jgi:hypothetical protein
MQITQSKATQLHVTPKRNHNLLKREVICRTPKLWISEKKTDFDQKFVRNRLPIDTIDCRKERISRKRNRCDSEEMIAVETGVELCD